ncbi:MAG: NHLP family bacteriocin export ABC transporter peptidase/permease/ATPase subunit [Azoarcus sp.]|jgi:NHLM bacteriocin system ABC transporter peptidase/ATP-binding protein|nr:NHLP family bacteriocin export ABC transporter peptidase/permease/ATPase subunit [Azoarcus sp.]
MIKIPTVQRIWELFGAKIFGAKIAKTPTVLQMEMVECGAAALSMILSYYGLFLPLEKLRIECGVNRDGSKASNMVKVAKKFGMTASGRMVNADKLFEANIPLIIHWNFNHFVVYEGRRGNKVYLNDPAQGHRVVTVEEFRNSFTGIALYLEPGADFKKGGKPYSVVDDVIKKLSLEKNALLAVMIIGAMMIIPGLAIPVFNQIYIDEILSSKHPEWLFNLMLAMGFAFLLQGALTLLRAWCLTRWQTKLVLSDSGKFFWHVLRLPVAFFQQRFSGEIAMRVDFNESVGDVLTGRAATIVLDMMIAFFFLILLLQYSVKLTVIGVSFSLLNVAVIAFFRKRLVEMSMKLQQDYGKAMGTAVSGVMAIETLKANGNEDDFFAKWAGYDAKTQATTQQLNITILMMGLLPAFFVGLNTALIMFVGGFQIMDGVMSAGIFIAFRSLMGNFQEPIGKLTDFMQSLQTTEMQMRRLDDVRAHDIDTMNYPTEQPAPIGRDKLTGRVELKEVSFGYSPLSPPLLENFKLTLEPGQWVALVGASGSGKSTIAHIISGLYHAWSGKVLFDGLERKDIPNVVIVNSIACVNQDIRLFSGTVRENLSLFDSSVSDADIIRGAQDALIEDDIMNTEGGYAHLLTEDGVNFSGGQRQRLEIARALALNPSFLIFDEATSALDPITEEKVLTNIRRRGCACLMVAHRLSAFRDCNEIIVLDRGKVVQRGTHNEMIAVEGPYRDMVSAHDADSKEK